MKTRITLLAALLMLLSSIFYSQDFNTAPAKTAVYDSLPEMKWHSETPMPEGRYYLGTASYIEENGSNTILDTSYILAMGGCRFSNIRLTDILEYNAISNQWRKLETNLPIEYDNWGCQAVTLNEKVYILGEVEGNSGHYDSKPAFLIYDIKAGTFERGADMLENYFDYIIGTYGDSLIYVMGGFSSYSLDSIQIYNVRNNSWSYEKEIKGREMNYSSGAICGGKIVLGGWTAAIGTIDPTDPYTIKWTSGEFPFVNDYFINTGSWYGKNKKYIFFTNENKWDMIAETWAYEVESGEYFKISSKKTPNEYSSRMVPVIRNDSVYMTVLGGTAVTPGNSAGRNPLNEWLYIGPNDELTADDIDIAALSIELDTAYINDINIPKATFRNRGLTAQKFKVTLSITPDGYSSTKEVNFGLGEKQINFDPWIPENTGTYAAAITAELTTDQDLTNNSLTASIEAVQRQISPLWHAEAGIADSTENLEAVYYLKKSGNPSIADTGYIIVFADLWEEGDGYSRGSISKYNTVTRTWSAPDSSFIWVRYYHPVQLGGKLYFIGGQVEGTTCIYCGNELMIYDIEKDSVYSGSSMLKQCDSYAIGAFADSLIYVLGGYSFENNMHGENNGFLNLAQIYNVNTDTWSYGTPFPGSRRCKISGSISGSTIVLAGGYSEQGDASTVDIGIIDPSDPSIIDWWQKPFLNQMNLENFPGGKTQGLASGAWFGRDTKDVYFAEGRKIWQYNVSTGVFSEMPEKIYTTDKLSALLPIVRNDSVYLAMIGRDKVKGNITNEWYYIGNDQLDPDISINEEPNITAPKEYSLSQNYPNPFNPSTKIKYSLREPGHVSLTVYDMLGREIKTLIDELMSAGEHEVIFNAAELNLSSGIYLYRISSGSFMQTKKLMLIK